RASGTSGDQGTSPYAIAITGACRPAVAAVGGTAARAPSTIVANGPFGTKKVATTPAIAIVTLAPRHASAVAVAGVRGRASGLARDPYSPATPTARAGAP